MPFPENLILNGRAFHRADNGHGFFARHVAGAAESSISSDPAFFAGNAGACLTNARVSRGISGH